MMISGRYPEIDRPIAICSDMQSTLHGPPCSNEKTLGPASLYCMNTLKHCLKVNTAMYVATIIASTNQALIIKLYTQNISVSIQVVKKPL